MVGGWGSCGDGLLGEIVSHDDRRVVGMVASCAYHCNGSMVGGWASYDDGRTVGEMCLKLQREDGGDLGGLGLS